MFKLLLPVAACLLAASLLVVGCKPTIKPPTKLPAKTVVIADDTLKDDWTAKDLFQNVLDQKTIAANEIMLGSDTAHLEIRAFQHHFFDDTARLRPTWVVGYVKAATPFGQESLPAPTLRATWGEPANVQYVSLLDTTLVYNTAYPYFKKQKTDTDSCRWYPVVYDINDPLYIHAIADMLYPKLTYLNGTDGIPICRSTGTVDSIPEMSSYYSSTVHLHGANVSWHNDGYVNSAFLSFPATAPPRPRIPFGLFGPKSGPEINHFASYTYPNTFPEGRYDSTQRLNQRGEHGAILWYHDHAMMRTTANVYAGLAGAYIIEGKHEYQAMNNANLNRNLNPERNLFRKAWDWIRGYENNDIALTISDKSFTKNGFLYYHSTSSLTDSDKEDVQPEFLGNTIAVNGKVWPKMEVEAETYRFRLLNTSSARLFRFGLRKKKGRVVEETGIDSLMVQIGTEGGLMPKFVNVTTDHPLTLAPGERADVLIDFSQVPKGDSLMLVNYAPNEVYQGDKRDTLTTITDTTLTNYVMEFVVLSDGNESGGKLTRELISLRKSAEYQNIVSNLDSFTQVSQPFDPATITAPFGLTLAEMAKKSDFVPGYPANLQNAATYPLVLMSDQTWDSEAEAALIPQTPVKNELEGTTEIWAIMNTTGDRHPIHIHLNRFKIKGRWAFDSKTFQRTGELLPTEPNERGWKDVVQCPPGQITYIEVRYLLNKDATQQNDPANQFVYHCHILEHEDAGMMRRLVVKPKL